MTKQGNKQRVKCTPVCCSGMSLRRGGKGEGECYKDGRGGAGHFGEGGHMKKYVKEGGAKWERRCRTLYKLRRIEELEGENQYQKWCISLCRAGGWGA